MEKKRTETPDDATRPTAKSAAPSVAMPVKEPETKVLVLRIEARPDGPGEPQTIRLPRDRGASLILGRAPDVDIFIQAPSLSRKHARILGGIRPMLEDLGSTNGSRVDGAQLRVGEPVPLEPGARVMLGEVTGRVCEVTARDAGSQLAEHGMIARDPKMIALASTCAVLARATCPVLILGETGVGKEVFAARAHELSARRHKPFLRLNCAALPGDMVESELFGFEKGAFTGATVSKPGLLETADGGSVLLDEIGELSLSAQAKLLRVLDTGEVTRLGAVKPRKLDVRVLSATHRDLPAMVAAGTFRADLYFRLAGAQVHVPPLRERPSDILALAAHFLYSDASAPGEPRFSEAVSSLLLSHAWPGNVRELRTTMERAKMLAGGTSIREEHIVFVGLGPPSVKTDTAALPVVRREPREHPPAAAPDDFYGALREREKAQIIAALNASGGNQTKAAESLGMPRRTLVKRLTEYGIRAPRRSRTQPPPD